MHVRVRAMNTWRTERTHTCGQAVAEDDVLTIPKLTTKMLTSSHLMTTMQ